MYDKNLMSMARWLTLSLTGAAGILIAQVDPGVRPGAAAAGGPLPGLTAAQLNIFNAAKPVFQQVNSVTGGLPGETGEGLGPSFNLNSCAGCHAFPDVGGSSPRTNPQVQVAALDGARNVLPSFITLNGPVREARFKRKPNGSPDGGVHDLFVITGRVDAPSTCTMIQTDFAPQLAAHNVIFRIPTPTFGNGLVEAISDSTILANKDSNALVKALFGISGHENRTGNDGTITRFGWKAQNKSLPIFAGEAYNVEQGVTNELFPNARETAPGCDAGGHPEDSTLKEGNPGGDVIQFALFMQLLAPPAPVTSYGTVSATSIQRGHELFALSGCALCHTESLTTGPAAIPALTNQPVRLFSDLLVHNMGAGLQDEIAQGNAAGNEFRTAPLWGLGQRIFLLHDGRTSDLVQAIRSHISSGSEGNISASFFFGLSASSQQDVLNFLRSL
jgi:CxxC motif-containing protein (DUF1111 family)